MAKKKATRKLAAGTKVRVKDGIAIPDFPEIACAGWSGTVVDTAGKKTDLKYIIEWDDSVVEAMPADYISQCEEKQYFYRMACFAIDDLETAS